MIRRTRGTVIAYAFVRACRSSPIESSRPAPVSAGPEAGREIRNGHRSVRCGTGSRNARSGPNLFRRRRPSFFPSTNDGRVLFRAPVSGVVTVGTAAGGYLRSRVTHDSMAPVVMARTSIAHSVNRRYSVLVVRYVSVVGASVFSNRTPKRDFDSLETGNRDGRWRQGSN